MQLTTWGVLQQPNRGPAARSRRTTESRVQSHRKSPEAEGAFPTTLFGRPMPTITLSTFEVGPLLTARDRGLERTQGSADLRRTQVEVELGDYTAARQGADELVREVGPRVPLLVPVIAYAVAHLLTAAGRDQDALEVLVALESTPGEFAAHQLATDLRATLARRHTPEQAAEAAAGQHPTLLAWLAELLARPSRIVAPTLARSPLPSVVGGLYIAATGETLSPRELDVLRLLMVGASNPAIASSLIISPYTVKNHVARILEKLGVATRTMAALRGRELGLAPAPQRSPGE